MKNRDFPEGKMVALRQFFKFSIESKFSIKIKFEPDEFLILLLYLQKKLIIDINFSKINFGKIFCVYKQFLLCLLGSKD